MDPRTQHQEAHRLLRQIIKSPAQEAELTQTLATYPTRIAGAAYLAIGWKRAGQRVYMCIVNAYHIRKQSGQEE